MQINLLRTIGKPEVVITHNDESIYWNVGAFDKSNFEIQFDMFQYNNLYWARMKEETKTAIFEVYKKIRIIFDVETDRSSFTHKLFPLIKELYEYNDLNEIEHYVLFHSDIQFPHDLEHEYIVSNERTGSRDQTYLRDDYIKLICLTLALRLMIPIWGEFIAKTKHVSGTLFKEYYAFHLLAQSSLNNSQAMNKLIAYVNCSIPEEKSKESILTGVSSEDFPAWILSLVIIRLLCVKDIRGIEPNSFLVPYIYNHVRERIKRNGNNSIGIVKDKKIESGSGSDSDNKTSKLEGYKIKQEISPGDVVVLEWSMENIVEVAKKLEPEIDEALVNNALVTSKVLDNQLIHESQIIVLQWLFKPYISPRGIMLLNKKTIVSALAAAQAILWHRGHYVIAGLITASTTQYHEEEMFVSGVDSRARITKDLVEKLNYLYPYSKKTTNKAKNIKNNNQAINSIDILCKLYGEKDWVLTLDPSLLSTLTGSSSIRRYSIPHDIKIKIAQLVIELTEKPRKISSGFFIDSDSHSNCSI